MVKEASVIVGHQSEDLKNMGEWATEDTRQCEEHVYRSCVRVIIGGFKGQEEGWCGRCTVCEEERSRG